MQLNSELSTISVLAIGFILGIQHAVEADHLAAISTIVSEKKTLWTASIVGGLWGVGHSISLFVVGILVIFLKLQLSETIQNRLEALVGIMLVVLGLLALCKLFDKSKIHIHSHEHGGHRHTHIHSHADEAAEASHHRFSSRSIVIGMIHGLAGSGALMFLILPTTRSSVVALSYVLVFGIGSIGGMMIMSLLIGLPFHLTAGRFEPLNRGIRLVAGAFSLVLGSSIIYDNMA